MTRRTLIRLNAFLGLLLAALLAVVIIGASGILEDRRVKPESWLQVPDDAPLMREFEKEDARETGIKVYQMGDRVYLDDSIPPEYYEEEE